MLDLYVCVNGSCLKLILYQKNRAQVLAHWSRAERFVLHKIQSAAEDDHRKRLDKQLRFLVEQTERFSRHLSQRLNEQSQPRNQGRRILYFLKKM